MPDEAKGKGEKSAKAFVEYYFDSLNFAAATGNSAALRRLGTSDCESCVAIRKNIDSIYSAGGSIEGDGWTLNSSRLIQRTKGHAVLSLDVFLEPQIVTKKSGAIERHDGGQQPMTMFIAWDGKQWLVSRLDLVS